jgi:hypothetical protein
LLRLEARDWVALDMHRWELTRGRRGVAGWILSAVAWLFAGVLSLEAALLSALWIFPSWTRRDPPLTMLETGLVDVGLLATSVAFVFPTLPSARRLAARRRAWQAVRRQIRRGTLHAGVDVCVWLGADGWAQQVAPAGPRWETVAWSAVGHIGMTDDYLFVGSDDGKWRVVSARAFGSRRAYEAFAARVRDFALAARGG